MSSSYISSDVFDLEDADFSTIENNVMGWPFRKIRAAVEIAREMNYQAKILGRTAEKPWWKLYLTYKHGEDLSEYWKRVDEATPMSDEHS